MNHLVAPVQVQTEGYYPSTCEFEIILNSTITACDVLDGKIHGVVARSDLCALNFNISSLIGTPYSCAATSTTGIGLGYGKAKRQIPSSCSPAENGTVSAEGVRVVQTLLGGLKDSQGRQVYFPFQPAAGFGAPTVYDSDTAKW